MTIDFSYRPNRAVYNGMLLVSPVAFAIGLAAGVALATPPEPHLEKTCNPQRSPSCICLDAEMRIRDGLVECWGTR